MEIMQNLWQVGGAGLTSGEDAAIYLIRFGDEAAIIDAGCGGAHHSLVNNISAALPAKINIACLFVGIKGRCALRGPLWCLSGPG